MSPIRKLLLGIFMLSLMSSAMGGGTFASFSATTTSGSSTFATGSLVLDFNKPGAACLSSGSDTVIGNNDASGGAVGEGATANEATCTALFTGLTGLKPGATSASTVDLTLENVGSLTASAMDFFWSGTGGCADASAGGTYVGNGNLCNAVEVTVTEYSNAARDASPYCWFGGNAGAGAPCTFSSSAQLGHLAQKHTAGATSTTISRWTSSLTTGAKKYLRIGIQLPDSGNQNALQGRSVSFALKATLTQ